MKALLFGREPAFAQELRTMLRLRWPDADVVSVGKSKPADIANDADLAFVGEDSLQLLAALRAASSLGIVVVATEERDEEMMEALDAGADDYMITPLTPARLVGRVGALLRRLRRSESAPSRHLAIGPLEIFTDRHVVQLDGQELKLTPTEFNLLYHLTQNGGDAVTTTDLHKLIWKCDELLYVDTLRKYVQRLRKKLNGNGAMGLDIVSIRGVGYRLAYRTPVPIPTSA